MTSSVSGKKILLYYPPFFGYDKEIANKIEELGGTVDVFNPRLAKSAMERALYKACPTIFDRISVKYHENILTQVRGEDYDCILVMESIPVSVLKRMRSLFPRAKLVCYFADSAKNMPNLIDRISCFDVVYSYDRVDAINYGMRFRPLFYIDAYRTKQSGREAEKKKVSYDVCFIGTCHSDRYEVIRKFEESCKQKGIILFKYLYLQSKFMYYFYLATCKGFRSANISEFHFTKISAEEASRTVQTSKAVFDVQHPNNNGLTIRTIEMIGMGKKIITTNKDVVNYDFYNKNNIMVVDRYNPTFDKSFFSSPYQPLTNEMYFKYSLDGWVNEVIGEVL